MNVKENSELAKEFLEWYPGAEDDIRRALDKGYRWILVTDRGSWYAKHPENISEDGAHKFKVDGILDAVPEGLLRDTLETYLMGRDSKGFAMYFGWLETRRRSGTDRVYDGPEVFDDFEF